MTRQLSSARSADGSILLLEGTTHGVRAVKSRLSVLADRHVGARTELMGRLPGRGRPGGEDTAIAERERGAASYLLLVDGSLLVGNEGVSSCTHRLPSAAQEIVASGRVGNREISKTSLDLVDPSIRV